jgi:dienelactone hydrolase
VICISHFRRAALGLAIAALAMVVITLVLHGNVPGNVTKDSPGMITNFTVSVDGKEFNVIEAVPLEKLDSYPLVIYHHGGGYLTLEPFELEKLAQRFAQEGFMFWAPQRSLWRPEIAYEVLEEAIDVRASMLELALNHPDVDRDDINVVGFCLGSWAVLEGDASSEHVRTASLLGFGAPFDDTLLYDYVTGLANSTDCSKISANVLVMVSRGDPRVDIRSAELLRRRMSDANKTISLVVYPDGDHLSMAGDKPYLDDLIGYLRGDVINTADGIDLDDPIFDKWESMWGSGYW